MNFALLSIYNLIQPLRLLFTYKGIIQLLS